MEKDLDSQLDKVFASGSLVGVVTANAQGLSLGSRGTVDPSVAGYVTLLATRAKELADNGSTEFPIVVIEADSYNVLVSRKDDVTTAIFKAPA